MFDPRVPIEVNAPIHYNTGNIECIVAIKESMSQDEFEGYLKGCALKYLWRYRYKSHPTQDLQKSIWYTTRLIKELGIENDGTVRPTDGSSPDATSGEVQRDE